MPAILQMIFSDTFSWIKFYILIKISLKFVHIEAETKGPPFCRLFFSDTFSWIKFYILIKISLKFVPKGPIDNNPELV